MPQLGESIAEATIVKVLFKEGSPVEADSDLIEVETNKAVMAVTSPCTGNLSQILVQEGQSYPVGAILGYVEVSAEEAAGWASKTKSQASASPEGKAAEPSGSSGTPPG